MEIVLLGSCSRHVYRIEFVPSILSLDEFGYLLVCAGYLLDTCMLSLAYENGILI